MKVFSKILTVLYSMLIMPCDLSITFYPLKTYLKMDKFYKRSV